MADGDQTGNEGSEGEGGSEQFDPKSLDPKAQEYIRREIQSQSDTKTGLVEKRLRDEQASRARTAVESAEQKELTTLAESGQHEALGQRVAARLASRSAEEKAIMGASDIIERQIADQFTEALGPGEVERIRQEVIKAEGAHAEFAKALADATGGKTRTEEIAAEVKAQLLGAGVKVRDEQVTGDKVTGSGQGNPPSTFEEIEQAYTEGKVSSAAYAAAKEARDKGQ